MKWASTILIFCVAVLAGLGLVMLYSSSMNMEQRHQVVGADLMLKQTLWLGIGIAAAVAAALFDYRRLKSLSPWLLGFSLPLLLLVFVPALAHNRNGAHRWITLPHGPEFQPSELARVALILFLAAYGDRHQRFMHRFFPGFLIPALVMGIILLAIFKEPDRGCTILLGSVGIVILVLAGVQYRHLLPAIALAVVVFYFYSYKHDTMRQGRVDAWLHPELAKDGKGYQGWQAIIALGRGHWTGTGLGEGRQKLGFVPFQHTDFIYSIIGEELGMVGTMSVALLFFGILLSGAFIATRAPDRFGFLLACGLTSIISFQALANMGVVTGLLPNKGFPLPFISYGGSNLLFMLISIGLLVSVARFGTAPAPAAAKSNPFDELPSPAGAGA